MPPANAAISVSPGNEADDRGDPARGVGVGDGLDCLHLALLAAKCRRQRVNYQSDDEYSDQRQHVGENCGAQRGCNADPIEPKDGYRHSDQRRGDEMHDRGYSCHDHDVFRVHAPHGIGLLGDDRPLRARRQENGFGTVDDAFCGHCRSRYSGEKYRLVAHLPCASGPGVQSPD